MHVGNLRTGLFAYLTAKHEGGIFVLRLEDTDKNREVEGSADHIKECLRLLGIEWDEGLDVGGAYAPYTQSQRLDIYRAWAQKLINDGRAYADPYTPEEVQSFREQAQKDKRPFLYRDHRPEHPPAWDGSRPLRFKSDPKPYTWHDEVMGDLHSGAEVIDDFILIKSDGYPTYNFAHIVDDAEMKISHVIRGQEFLSSQPNYMNLYEALGLTPPTFATMPHILNEQGNKKLGKRDGAKDVLDYARAGYLPETLLSFIATMGWNDGTEQELFTKRELIDKFNLGRVQRSGARFDEKRLLWMNGQFIRQLSVDDLYGRVADFWPQAASTHDESFRKRVLSLAQDRLKTLPDLAVLTSFFFEDPSVDMTLIDGNKQLSKLTPRSRVEYIESVRAGLGAVVEWSAADIQAVLNEQLVTTGQKPGVLFSLVRICTTWAPFSPQLDLTLELLGKPRTLARLDQALDALR